MSSVENLRTILWADFENHSADLFSRREGPHPIHGIALNDILTGQKDIGVTPHYLRRDDCIALDHKGLILLGNPLEFSPSAERLAHTAGYPARFVLAQDKCGISIVERQQDAGPRVVATNKEHYGLIFRGNSDTLPARPTLLFFGTSPLGILAGARFAIQHGLSEIPSPPGFPECPIEALVPLQRSDDSSLPALSDLGVVRVVCGTAEWNSHRSQWIEDVHLPQIKVLIENGEARAICIGTRKIAVSESDISQLLLLIAERSAAKKWTTIKEAQFHIDKKVLTKRYHTLHTRIAEIGRLFPLLLETSRDTQDGSLGYRLQAAISFIETSG